MTRPASLMLMDDGSLVEYRPVEREEVRVQTKTKKGRGRPKGSKNKTKEQPQKSQAEKPQGPKLGNNPNRQFETGSLVKYISNSGSVNLCIVCRCQTDQFGNVDQAGNSLYVLCLKTTKQAAANQNGFWVNSTNVELIWEPSMGVEGF